MEILGEGVDMNDNEMQTTSDTKKKCQDNDEWRKPPSKQKKA